MHREQRVITRCRVEYQHLERTIVAESEDLSRRGVFVRTDELLPAGTVIELSITLPGEHLFTVIARVAHLLSPSAARALGRRPGMGFEFLDQEENQGRDRLLEYLEDLIEEFTPAPFSLPLQCRVLVADPSGPLLERVSNALHGAGFEVDAAANGAEAYSVCGDQTPDVIVCAEIMPVVDGWTLIKMIQAKPRLSAVPIMLMSEDASDMTRLRAYRCGVRDYLHKPFTDEEMVIRLRRLAMETPRPAHGAMLRGNLAEISLATLLSLLEFERKSGVLIVLRNQDAARLFVAGGRVVKIEGPSNGGDALTRVMTVLDWSDGNFEFSRGEVVGGNEVNMSTSMLLLEHARIRDEETRN